MLKSCPKSRGTVFSYDGLRRAEPLSCAVPPPDGAVIAHGEQDGPVPGQGGLPHCRCTLRNADQVFLYHSSLMENKHSR